MSEDQGQTSEQPDAKTLASLADVAMDPRTAFRFEQFKSMEFTSTKRGLSFLPQSFSDVVLLAERMAASSLAVPPHLRGDVGACIGVCMQTYSWGFENPFAVAAKSYVVSSVKNPDAKLAWEAQLIAAIVFNSPKFRDMPTAVYSGEGDTRKISLTLHFQGGTDRPYESPELGKISPRKSPLWVNEPDQQLFYYGIRAAARRWASDVILGLYTPEELTEGEGMKDITQPQTAKPDLLGRLGADRGDGFSNERTGDMERGRRVPMIEQQASEVVPMKILGENEKVAEPIRSGVSTPAEVVSEVRAAARTPAPEGTQDWVPPSDDRKADTAEQSSGEPATSATEPKADEGVAAEDLPVAKDLPVLLQELHNELLTLKTDKAVRTRWRTMLEKKFEAVDDKGKGEANRIINSHLKRLKAEGEDVERETAECVEYCKSVIVRAAHTGGDLFAAP